MKKYFSAKALACLVIAASLVLGAYLLPATAATGQEANNTNDGRERIISYDVTVRIKADSSIDVTESIKVFTRGRSIRLGMERDFPLSYPMGWKEIATPVHVDSVLRNGKPEHFWSKNVDGVYRLYIGEKEDLLENRLPHGVHTYTIHWTGKNHIRGFEEYDELYLNAIGHEWSFDIDSASVTVILADGTEVLQAAAYMGVTGSTTPPGVMDKETTYVTAKTERPLHRGEGLTIAVGFTKGVLHPANSMGPYGKLVNKIINIAFPYMNANSLTLIFTLLMVICYYILVWRKWGKDQDLGPIVPQYSPAPDMTVEIAGAALDADIQTIFVASAINQAAHGQLIISDKSLSVPPQGPGKSLKDIQASSNMQTDRFWHGAMAKSPFMLDRYDPNLLAIFKQFKERLLTLQKEYIRQNSQWVLLGLLAQIAALYLFSMSSIAFNFIFWLSTLITVHAIITYLIVRKAKAKITAILLCFFATIQFYLWGWQLLPIQLENLVLFPFISSGYIILSLALGCCHIIFYHLMKKPTPEGSRRIAELMGLRMFMAATDEQRFKLVTPEVFEKNLPYAILFGLEQKWLKEFNKLQPEYSPGWYHSEHTHFSKGIGKALSQGVSRGIISPSQRSSSGGFGGGSSGSHGGGFSGGGSGGGGGRGR